MKKLLLLFFIVLLVHCSKDEPIRSEKVEPVKEGFDYFLNTNENWYYFYTYSGNFIKWTTEYKVLRDTNFLFEGDSIHGKILEEHLIQDGPVIEGYNNYYETTMETIFYYNSETRILNRVDMEGRENLGKFGDLDYITGCDSPIIYSDTIQIGENYYTRYINELNQEIIEGILLGFNQCKIYPPFNQLIPVGRLKEIKYTSDEFSYHWKLP